MKCNLLTADRGFVTHVEIPPFDTPPEILIWGERFFQLDRNTAQHVVPEYLEAFTFFVPALAAV